jgi:type VI secretion system secreted protein VgrG
MGHPRADQNQEYLITGADYRLEESPPESELADTELFSVRLQAIPSAQTYQPPRLTPSPSSRARRRRSWWARPATRSTPTNTAA